MFKRMKSNVGGNDRSPIQLTEVNGKPALVFDEMPALVFVSNNGHGSFDKLYIDGVESVTHRNVTITSEVGEITTYSLDKYAIRTEEVAEDIG
ncbi:hypothetical protein JNUCC32_31475 (plasmid) [Paenibacillus sp. JNUCC32]|uniref:hypothetical protein n=1 Tax=Paenibacillus sp. JNUCC32 TaxID=2777984 RepID=UPI0017878686|nr:hypothetical protein [Paenibacillus sp. JNUCC-32]QOT13718.1 hypothetical protein JNUCC32_31475 [Paenibacillus sp. JNUCC-32]